MTESQALDFPPWKVAGRRPVTVSAAMTLVFLGVCLVTVWWIFKTGYRLKN